MRPNCTLHITRTLLRALCRVETQTNSLNENFRLAVYFLYQCYPFLSAWAPSVASPNVSRSQVTVPEQDLMSGGHQHRTRQHISHIKWTHSCCVLKTILAKQVTSLLPLQPRSLVFQIFSNEIIYQSLRYKNGKCRTT